MANGDKAAAAGLAVFAGTQDRREGYDNDNVRGDEIADVMARIPAGKMAVAATEPAAPSTNDLWFW
jgi:hypothetical protein